MRLHTFLILAAAGTLLASAAKPRAMRGVSSVGPAKVYAGQPVVYSEWVELAGEEVVDIRPISAPRTDGFAVSEISGLVPDRKSNADPFCIALRSFLLLPQPQDSLIEVGGGGYQISHRVPRRVYDPVMGDGVAYTVETQDIWTPQRKVRVIPLPPRAPESFGGLIGDYTLSYVLPPDGVEAGETAVFAIRMEGKGFLEEDKLPNLQVQLPKSVRTGKVEVEPQVRLSLDGIESVADFVCEFVVPDSAAIHLPELQVTVFNPHRGKYEVVRAAPAELSVSKAKTKQRVSTLYVRRDPGEDETRQWSGVLLKH